MRAPTRKRYTIPVLFSIALVACYSVVSQSPFAPRPPRVEGTTDEGYFSLTPNEMAVAQVGDYRLTYTVGPSGIAVGGGIRVDFPKEWFSNPVPLVKPVQTDDPTAPHYIGAEPSRPGATLSMRITHGAADGSIERFRHAIELTVQGDPLQERDTIQVTFANTTSPIITGLGSVNVALDVEGSGIYRARAFDARIEHPLKPPGSYTVRSGPPARVLVSAPTTVRAGEKALVQIAVLDSLHNPVPSATGTFPLHGVAPDPESWFFIANREGWATRFWTPKEPGIVRIGVGGPLESVGAVVRVIDNGPAERIYWGDLHSHTTMSKDGVGLGDFEYARDVAGLDFYARTDHGGDDGYSENEKLGDSISSREWESTVRTVRRLYAPGDFVTLLAYECSLPTGHHNVIYRGLNGEPWPAYRVKSTELLWDRLEAGEALTIPHHLGVQWGGRPNIVDGPGLQQVQTGLTFGSGPRLDWTREHRADLRPALEMYSKHGQSEYYDRNDPLSYEQVRYTRGRSAEGEHYAQDAWAAGHVIGTVAASDNHTAHPGLPHTGLTAVYAPELTREAVFDALLNRRTYATTGVRMIMDFQIGDGVMGQEVQASGVQQGRVAVESPSPIKFAEVLAHSGDGGWKTVQRWENPGLSLDEIFTIDVEADTVAYLRVELTEPVWGRIARGWTSPIWVRP